MEQAWLWWADVRSLSEASLHAWSSTLDARERGGRLRFAADRVAYVTAHVLLRLLLAEVCRRPPSIWQFAAGPYGKPYVDPSIGVSIGVSLSHTRGLAAAAVCASADVGVDAERTKRLDGLALAEHHFASVEVDRLRKLSPPRRQEAFLRLWTLKEAWSKATGRGLSSSLDEARFTLDPFEVDLRGADDDARTWQFHCCTPTAEHVLSLALRHGGAGRRVEVVERAILHEELASIRQ